jgi:hypothetical protein
MKKAILILIFFPFFVFSSSGITFPKEKAGMSAYIKTEDINENNNVTKINEAVAFFESLEGEMLVENESTHVIGKIPVKIEIEEYYFYLYPYIYIDIEGWVVAYFHKNDPSSKIIQWTNYSPSNYFSTTLENALEEVTEELNLSYSSLSYYHFQYPEADRMTIIIDTVTFLESSVNNFSVTIPGTLYESSYSLYYERKLPSSEHCPVELVVDGKTIHKKENMSTGWNWCQGKEFIYNFYPENTFTTEKPHSVVFKDNANKSIRQGAGTVILYKN